MKHIKTNKKLSLPCEYIRTSLGVTWALWHLRHIKKDISQWNKTEQVKYAIGNLFFFFYFDLPIFDSARPLLLCGLFSSCDAAAAAKSLQSCPTLCDPIDSSPPGSPVPGILQARTLERVAISFSNAWDWKMKVKSLSRVRFFATPWTAAHQAPPSMRFSRQEY